MKLKVQHVMDATPVLASIINERRPLPQKGKYRVARLHAKLLPEYQLAAGRRDDMIMAYGTPQMVTETDAGTGETREVATGNYQVPADKVTEFNAAWKQVADEEIDVEVEPIPLAYLSLNDETNGAIEAGELITLGDLVAE